MNPRTLMSTIVLAIAFGLSGGCSTGSSGTVQLSVAVNPPNIVAPKSPAMLSGMVVSAGNDTLLITDAAIVLKKIELEGRSAMCDEDGDGDIDEKRDGCEELRAGPMLVSLPLAPGAVPAVTVPVAAGTYGAVEFRIHVPNGGDAADQAFRAAHPDFANASIRVVGTFNGQPFVFVSSRSAKEEIDLDPPLLIAAGTTTATLTLHIDLSAWFRTRSGALIPPATANAGGPNEDIVNDNIRGSMRAFKDRDLDGVDDERER
jgi:hypothetical protein